MAKKTTGNKKGNRYTSVKKAEIVSWVNAYNAKNGRGGVANASKKFGITQLTIGNWVKNAGGSTKGGGKISSSGAKTLRKLADHLEQIAEKETELAKLKKQYNELKRKI